MAELNSAMGDWGSPTRSGFSLLRCDLSDRKIDEPQPVCGCLRRAEGFNRRETGEGSESKLDDVAP